MASERQFPNDKYYDLTATISAGSMETPSIDLQGLEIAGIFIPPEFDGTQLTLKTAPSEAATFMTVQDGAGNDFMLTVAAGKYAAVPNLSVIAGLRFIKIVAATPQTTTDTILTLALRSL